jgi:transcription initiation factor IIE alpha subunit
MKLEFDLECPNCKRKMAQKVEAMRPGSSTRCPGCGAEIRFSGDDGRRAQKALDDLTKSLKNLSIKL